MKAKGIFYTLKIVVLVAAIAVVVLLGLKFTGLFDGLKNLFNFNVSIDKTANVVEQIKASAEFTSVCFYDEFVMNYTKENTITKSSVNKFFKDNLNVNVASKDRLVLICKGKVRAGFDLKKVGEKDINVHGDTLELVLPEAQYFDIVLNPSDFEYFERTGEWSHNQDTQIKKRAEERLMADADKQGILEKAETIGLARLEVMYKGLGFNVVNLSVRHETVAEPEVEETESPVADSSSVQ